MSKIKMRLSLIFIYSVATTFSCFQFEGIEAQSIFVIILVMSIIFSPILYVIFNSEIGQVEINVSTSTGFIVGFLMIIIQQDINLGPIALLIWLVLSVPSIIIFNLIGYIYRRFTHNQLNQSDALQRASV